ncbi:hypothetical protein QIA_1351 [Clostridioides difficile 6057]|nr:hypothetical protein QCS_1331 [Clostridioides difficile CD51]EQE81347.1 hypothetical protein QCU_1338 [Clostridioides difficile CD68]EQF11884.1 hypothetical protein QEO_1446 [Clostridioides difficile CD133]EQF46266.1 hypothetical protein QG5_1337 [Clostridioides difficile CD170]EQF89582.1 hypothetical protein QGU_1423 [Clostridioides difficile 655]EQG10376.1 hypothetical protein QI7_3090 [Clostridioides difficile 6042]EQG12872.1 hypothetical protein QIA_1351 [Clostridioides difficile 6057]
MTHLLFVDNIIDLNIAFILKLKYLFKFKIFTQTKKIAI